MDGYDGFRIRQYREDETSDRRMKVMGSITTSQRKWDMGVGLGLRMRSKRFEGINYVLWCNI